MLTMTQRQKEKIVESLVKVYGEQFRDRITKK